MRPMDRKCDASGRPCSTAYNRGCRCESCIAWRRHYRSWKAPKRDVEVRDSQTYGTRARACEHAKLVARRLLESGHPGATALLIALDHFDDMLREASVVPDGTRINGKECGDGQ